MRRRFNSTGGVGWTIGVLRGGGEGGNEGGLIAGGGCGVTEGVKLLRLKTALHAIKFFLQKKVL